MKMAIMLALAVFLLATSAYSASVDSFGINDLSRYDFDTFNCQELDEEEYRPHCESTKSFIRGCYSNPNSCDCDYFDEPKAKAQCQKWVDDGIKLMGQKSQECMDDLYNCDCKTLPHTRLINVCEAEKNKFIGKLRALEQSCFNDPASCDCGIFEESQYIAKCEGEIAKAEMIAQSCAEDIGNCDCSIIDNPIGRAKCQENKDFYINYENEFRQNCEENFDDCDCSTIPSLAGQQACENEKAKVLETASAQVYSMLYECFQDINECDCQKLENQEYADYCEETKDYGFACMQTGGMGCEKLDSITLYPPNLPEFLRPYFSQTFKKFIEDEKIKGMSQASGIATNCVIDPHNCDCSSIPIYAREFCLDKKEMQIDCIGGNVSACEILDQTINVIPLNAPKFVRDFLDPLLRPLMLMQKEQIKGQYAQMVKEQMILCINDETSCDCESIPLQYQSFCNEKIQLVNECKSKNYESCFRLMDESNIPSDIPVFISIFVEGSVNYQVEQRMNEVFQEIKPSVCEGMNVRQCRQYYDNNCQGLSVNACLKKENQ